MTGQAVEEGGESGFPLAADSHVRSKVNKDALREDAVAGAAENQWRPGKVPAATDDTPDLLEEKPSAAPDLVIDVADGDPDDAGGGGLDRLADPGLWVLLRHQVQQPDVVPGPPRRRSHACEAQGKRRHVDPFGIGGDQEDFHKKESPAKNFLCLW